MLLNKRRSFLLILSLGLAGARGAAPNDPRTLDERLFYFHVGNTAQSMDPANPAYIREDARREDTLRSFADVLGTSDYALVYYALPPQSITDDFHSFLNAVDKARVDQQIGSSPSAGASTTVAARTGLSTLLGFALESGAVTQTIDQNVATLRANADGLIRFLSNQELFPACSPSDPRCDPTSALKNLELSVSFNVSDAGTKTLAGVSPSSASPVDFSALLTKHEFSSATARYALLNNRDPRSKAYREKWLNWFRANQSVLQAAGKELLTNIASATLLIQRTGADGKPTRDTGNPDQYTLWVKETRDKLDAAPKTEAAWKIVLQQQLDALLAKMRALDPDFDRKLADMGQAYVRYLALRRNLESTLITDPGLTLEYTFSQPTLQPKLHTIKIAYAYSPKGAPGTVNPGTITFNAALDFFQDPQLTGTRQDTSRWKDAQAALQFDRPLGPADSPAQLSVGAYYQYQIHPGIFTIPAGATMLPGTNIPLPPSGSQILAQKGSIFVAQATMTVRIASSGLKVPMGISWSNRTDLVKGNEVRGHVGFTFDSTPLFLLPGLK